MDLFYKIVVYLGGGTVIITGIVVYASKIVAKKLSITWQHENNKHIELLKGEIAKYQSLTTNLLSTYSSGFQLAQQNRINAIEKLWDNILIVKSQCSSIALIYGILTEKEIETAYSDTSELANKTRRQFFDKLDIMEYAKNIRESQHQVEKLRLFIGDDLWRFFHLYVTFTGRAIHLLVIDKEKKKTTIWHKDKSLVDALKQFLTDPEIKYLLSLKHNSFTICTDLLEQKVINGSNKILTGELAMENSLEQVKKLNEHLKAVSIPGYEKH